MENSIRKKDESGIIQENELNDLVINNDMNTDNEFVDLKIDEVDITDGKTNKRKQGNSYAAKKTAAQGLMDVALLTANANQLRYINEYGNSNNASFYLNIILISLSIILQVAVGVTLIMKGSYYYRGKSKNIRAKQLNNHILVGIFLITIINIFVASFTRIGP